MQSQNQPPETMCKELLAVAKKYPRIVQAHCKDLAYCKGAVVSDGGKDLYLSVLHSNTSPLTPPVGNGGKGWLLLGSFQ